MLRLSKLTLWFLLVKLLWIWCHNNFQYLIQFVTMTWRLQHCGAGIAYPYWSHEFALVFSRIRVVRSLVFCVMFCLSLFVLFRLDIALSALRFTVASLESSTFLTLWDQRKMSRDQRKISKLPIKVNFFTLKSISILSIINYITHVL